MSQICRMSAILASATMVALAQQTIKPRIAIKTFENPAAYYNSTIGNALSEILVTELGQIGKYVLLERQAVDEVLKEIRFAASDAAERPDFSKLGRLLAADCLLLGKVTNFSYQETEEKREVHVSGRSKQTVTEYSQQADVRVDFRLINVTTGEIMASEAGKATRKTKSRHSQMHIWRDFIERGQLSFEWPSSLLGRASVDAVKNVAGKLGELADEVTDFLQQERAQETTQRLRNLQGKILGAVTSEEFVIDLGSKDGLVVGDQVLVSRETSIKDKRGKEIWRKFEELGRLEVNELSPEGDRAKGRFLARSATPGTGALPQEGDVVRVDLERAAVLRARAPTPKSAEELLRRGEALMDRALCWPALRRFRQAESVNPNDPAILARIASAYLCLRNFSDLGDVYRRILDMGGAAGVEVHHDHFLGFCTGTLAIHKGALSYQPRRGDHGFEALATHLRYLEVSEKETPGFHVRFVGTDNKEKKYNFTPAACSRIEKGTVMVEEGDREDCVRLLRLLQRLAMEYVK